MQQCQKKWYDQCSRERETELYPTEEEVYMPDKQKRRSAFHVNTLKKWYPPKATCFWTAEDTESEEDKVVL